MPNLVLQRWKIIVINKTSNILARDLNQPPQPTNRMLYTHKLMNSKYGYN